MSARSAHARSNRSPAQFARGFTLIELVVAMSISVIVIGFMALLITVPVDAHFAQVRRAGLTDAANEAWQPIAREVRSALPNSLRAQRNGTIVVLEMLAVADWARYRIGTTNPTRELDLAAPDSVFWTAGKFANIPRPLVCGAYHLVINNRGILGADAYTYAPTGVITPASTCVSIDNAVNAGVNVPGEDEVTLSVPFHFVSTPPDSPAHRVFLVSGPVTFLCNETAGTLSRYSGYTIAANQAARDTDAELMGASASRTLVARNVTTCNFLTTAATADHGGTVAAQITVSQNGESLQVIQQAHVENPP